MIARATIDWETRSACSIRNCGSWRYSLDPTTELLCLAYRLPYWPKGRTGLWHPAFPQFGIEEGESFDDLVELFAWISNGDLVEAHNAFFERGIWTNIAVPRYGWPAIGHWQWRCSAAKAASHALPRALSDAAFALNLSIRKDEEGEAIMKKMVKPRNPLKSERLAWARLHAPCCHCEGTGKVQRVNPETGKLKKFACIPCSGAGHKQEFPIPEMPTLYHESVELFEALWAYCRQDVLAEDALSERLPDLSDDEQELYLLDQQINERGFQLDESAIDTALTLIDGEFVELNAELAELTGGTVLKATQRAKMLTWFNEKQGLDLPDTQAETLDWALKRTNLSAEARRGLEIVRTLGRSSTAKYEAMRNWIGPDSRVHGGLLYHGASTGRWTGSGIQPHNFPRPTIKEDPEVLWEVLKLGERETIIDNYGNVMEALASGLRGTIVPSTGKQLYVADFSSIEPRVLFWLADDQQALDIFRSGKCIYMDFASSLYGYPVTDKKKQDTERQFGKVGILALGYGQGKAKFPETAYALSGGKVNIPETAPCKQCRQPEHAAVHCAVPEFALKSDHPFEPDNAVMTSTKVVDAYRSKYWRVKKLWYALEDASCAAVANPGKTQRCGKVTWLMEKGSDFLYCILPSGRRLAYPSPKVEEGVTPWGDPKLELSYKGVNGFNHSWQYQHSYGGLLAENVTQAVARDLLADAMKRCEASGVYLPILSVHDEVLTEAPKGAGSVKDFIGLMTAVPDWGKGIPVAADGYCAMRYRKG